MIDKNKDTYLLIGIAVVVLSTILILNLDKTSSNEITCNFPYIKFETSCCLDSNSNDICDNNEAPTNIQEIEKFSTYDSQAYKIRIGYPSDWTKEEGTMGTVVMFLSPLEDNSDDFQENVNLLIQDLSTQPMTLEEYTTLSVDQIGQFINDIKIIDSSETILDGNLGHRIIYTGTQGRYNIKWMQIWTIKNNKAYILSYTSELDKYSDFLGTAQEMINSFEII